MKFGVEFLKINYIPSPDLEFVEKEMDALFNVWTLKESWDKKWEEIKHVSFR